MWEYNEINFKSKGDVAQSTLMIWKSEGLSWVFRCQFLRNQKKDQLTLIPIDLNGNIKQFQQLFSHMFVQVLRQKSAKRFPEVVIHLYNGVIKIKLKQRRSLSAFGSAIPTTSIINDKYFRHLFDRNLEFLKEVEFELKSLDILFGNRKISQKKSTRINEKKQMKLLEEQFYRSVKQVLNNSHEKNSENQKSEEIQRQFSSQHQKNFGSEYLNYSHSSSKEKLTAETSRQNNIYELKKISFDEKNSDKEKKILGGAGQILEKTCESLIFMKEGKQVSQKNKKIGMKKPKVLLQCNGRCRCERSDCKKVMKQNEIFQIKLEREIKILKYLGYKPYLLNYYKSPEEPFLLYMDFLDLNLYEFMYYYRQSLSIQDLFKICKQIVYIINDLHQSGVIHRDLKLSNFMVDLKNGLEIKIIDFSDSTTLEEDCSEIHLCGTLPYSPLECSNKCKIYEQSGKQKKQIDYWSVGMLLHEFFYGFFPLSYSYSMAKDIQALWSSEFLYIPRPLKKRGLSAIQSIIHLITYLMIQIKQKNRLDSSKTYSILGIVEEYQKKIYKFCSSVQSQFD